MSSKNLAVLAVIALCFVSSGCWDRREIESLGFVTLTGLDRKPPHKIMITVQVAKPFAIATGGTRPVADERTFWLTSSTGETVFEAVRGFLSTSPRRLFWGHSRFIIIGEELARDGVQECLDFFARDGEPRIRAKILVARGHRAADILQAGFELERLPLVAITGITEGLEGGAATTVQAPLLIFNRALEDEGMEPTAACIELVGRPSNKDQRGSLKNDVISVSASVKGAAAFRGDRLVGWLTEREAKGLNWVWGKIRNTIVVVKNPLQRHPQKAVSIEILRATSSIKPSLRGGQPVIDVEIEAEGNLGESQVPFDPLVEKDWRLLEKQTAGVIKRDVNMSVFKAKALNSDIFGFGRCVRGSFPRQWYGGLKQQWYDIFPGLEVHVKVKVNLQKSGLILRTLKSR